MSNERKSTVLLEHYLKQLKLPTMLKEYSLLAKSCSQEKCDYPTYLLRLCEKEIADRQRRAMDRRIKAAKFGLLNNLLVAIVGASMLLWVLRKILDLRARPAAPGKG